MSQAENYGYKLTDSYLSAEFSWVLLRRHNGALNKVAVAYDFSPSALEMPGLSDTAHVEHLDSFDDCLAAVRTGTVDAYYTYTYQAERTVFDDTRNELRSMLSGEQRNFCIGVRQDYDVLLRTVLNKSIDQPDPRRDQHHHQRLRQPGAAAVLPDAAGLSVPGHYRADLPVRSGYRGLHRTGHPRPTVPRRD